MTSNVNHHPLPLAVYGTLRPGGRAYQAFDMERRTRNLGPCRIAGRIVDLGGYPGLVGPTDAADGERVVADLLELIDPALMAELDAYEGPDYQRVSVMLAEPPREALVWRWRHDVSDAQPVPSNDWTLRHSDEIDPADDPVNRTGRPA